MASRDISEACSILRTLAVPCVRRFSEINPGYVIRPVSILRTTEEQQAAYAQGRTTPGQIVTKIDGVHQKSAHQRQVAHGEVACHAMDFGVFDGWNEDAKYLTDTSDPTILKLYNSIGDVAAETGLAWGGNLWRTFTDRPHVQCLPEL